MRMSELMNDGWMEVAEWTNAYGEMEGWMSEKVNKLVVGWIPGWLNKEIDGWMDGWMDTYSDE